MGLRSLNFEDIILDSFANKIIQGYKSFGISGISKSMEKFVAG